CQGIGDQSALVVVAEHKRRHVAVGARAIPAQSCRTAVADESVPVAQLLPELANGRGFGQVRGDVEVGWPFDAWWGEPGGRARGPTLAQFVVQPWPALHAGP